MIHKYKHLEIIHNTGELAYDGSLYPVLLAMTDDMLGPSPMHMKYVSYIYDRLGIWIMMDQFSWSHWVCPMQVCLYSTRYYRNKCYLALHCILSLYCGYIIQIWHPCVVYNWNNSPERGLSPEGVARGRQSSRGGVIPVVHHTGMSYLFYYTEQHTKHKRGKMTNTRNFG